jgi:hypothetical protein
MAKQQMNDGGPAFPRPHSQRNPFETWNGQRGLSLRDWFAGQALVGLVRLVESGESGERIVEGAYEIADAMLAQRKARHG